MQCGPKIATYPWPAEDLVTCVSRQTGLSAAAVERPTVVQNPLFPLALLGGIVVGGAVAWKLYNSPIVRITGLWTLGALAVYWFATSGGMYNIIRGIPFSIVRDGKKVYWMDVSADGGFGLVCCPWRAALCSPCRPQGRQLHPASGSMTSLSAFT